MHKQTKSHTQMQQWNIMARISVAGTVVDSTKPRPWGARRGAKRWAPLAGCGREGWCGSAARLWRGQLRRAAAPLEVRDAAMGDPNPAVFWREEPRRRTVDRVWLVRAPPVTVFCVLVRLALVREMKIYLTSRRMFGILQGFLDINKKTNYIARLKTVRRIY